MLGRGTRVGDGDREVRVKMTETGYPRFDVGGVLAVSALAMSALCACFVSDYSSLSGSRHVLPAGICWAFVLLAAAARFGIVGAAVAIGSAVGFEIVTDAPSDRIESIGVLVGSSALALVIACGVEIRRAQRSGAGLHVGADATSLDPCLPTRTVGPTSGGRRGVPGTPSRGS